MPFKWEKSPGEVFPAAMEQYVSALYAAGRQVAEERSDDITEWMKTNAPWTDRTGLARAGLAVESEQEAPVLVRLTLHYNPELEYPIYLETKDQGRFGILPLAVDRFGSVVLADLQKYFDGGL